MKGYNINRTTDCCKLTHSENRLRNSHVFSTPKREKNEYE